MGYTVVQRVITSNDWAYSYLDRFARNGPESDHILSAGKAAACDREPGFLFRAAHADGTGCCKVCGVRFQELAVCPEGVPKASGKVSWEAKDAEV